MSIENSFRTFQESGVTPKADITKIEPKKMYRDLLKVVHPVYGGNDEDTRKVIDAYREAESGQCKNLEKLYRSRFPDKIFESVVDGGNELSEWEKIKTKEREIEKILHAEIHKLYKLAIKQRSASILKNNQLKEMYIKLCEDRDMDPDAEFINRFLYDYVGSRIKDLKKQKIKI